MKTPSLPVLLACGVLAGALLLWAVRPPARPATAAAITSGRPPAPPGPDAPHPAIAEPHMPELTPAWRTAVTNQVKDVARPGAAAFRAMSDLYVDRNLDFARAQAAAEGLTVDEVRELTYLGLLVLATQRVPEVEDVLGRTLDDRERADLAALMRTSNDVFKRDLRALVAAGGAEAERRQLIRTTEDGYLARFAAITSIEPDQLDALLGGNILLPGAPIAGPPIPDSPAADDRPPDSPLPRPRPTAPVTGG